MQNSADWLSPLRERDFIPTDAAAVCLVGSLARGWSNPQSDVDIVVFAPTEWKSETSSSLPLPLNPGRVQSESFYMHDRRWEVVYWLTEHLDQILAKVSWDQFERNIVAYNLLSQREELLISRLAHCLPLSGEDWVKSAVRRIEESAFQTFMITRSLSAADDAVEDALGQLEGEDLESAVLSARRALGFSIDALLESHGEYLSPIPKWRPQRFRAAEPALMTFEKYWELETMQTYDPGDPSLWVNQVLNTCQEISLRVEPQG